MMSSPVNYETYTMSVREWLLCMLKAGIMISAVCHIFFQCTWLTAAVFLLGAVYPRYKAKEAAGRCRQELLLQFKDLLQSLSSSVLAGKPIETAFRESYKDLCYIYQESQVPIIKEVQVILRKIDTNETIEIAFGDFAERSGLEDIVNFSYTLSVCKRAGGDIPGMISNTVSIIGDKIDMSYEVDIILAERRMERKILIIIPVFLVALLSYTASGYMYPVYSSTAGRIAMIAALALFGSGYLISRKIMNVRL